jgi:hypothetical protein
MQAHRLRDCQAESTQQILSTKFFVAVVDATQRPAIADIMEHVTDIVQQCGRDKGRGFARPLGKKSALERVLALRDRLFPILPDALDCEQVEQAVDDLVHSLFLTLAVILSWRLIVRRPAGSR